MAEEGMERARPETGLALPQPEISIPPPKQPNSVWKTTLVLVGSGLVSLAGSSFSNYLQTRGFVSVEMARIFLAITWLAGASLVVISVMAFGLKKRLMTIGVGICVLTGTLVGLELWAVHSTKPSVSSVVPEHSTPPIATSQPILSTQSPADLAKEIAKNLPQPKPQQHAFVQLRGVETILKDYRNRPYPYAQLLYFNPGVAPATSVKVEFRSSCPLDGPNKPGLQLERSLFNEATSKPTVSMELPSLGIGGEALEVRVPLPCISSGNEEDLAKWMTARGDFVFVVGRISFADSAGKHTAETCRYLVPPAAATIGKSFSDVNSMGHAMVNGWGTCKIHDGPGPDK
jgi:hypothetical protein